MKLGFALLLGSLLAYAESKVLDEDSLRISFLSLGSSLSFLCPKPDSLHLDFFSFSAPDMVSDGPGCDETAE